MKKYFHQKIILILLAIFLMIISCDAQVKTDLPKESVIEQKKIITGQPKLIKTQGSNLSDNVCNGLQDKAGNLWFVTTGEGVYRYDGKLFQQFTIKDGLSSNTVRSILEDQYGDIWFGTADGICRYDGKTMRRFSIALAKGRHLFPFTTPNNNPAEKNTVYSMIQDNSGTIWFGTTTGVYCYDGKSFTRFIEQPGLINKGRLSLQSVQCMLQDKNGNIWFGSGPLAFEGICLYDGKSLVNFKPKDEGWIRNIIEDENGNIWFGTRRNGACRYDGKNFTYDSDKVGIGNPLLVDRNGNIWFAGDEKPGTVESVDGIWRYNGKDYTNFNIKDGLGKYFVWSMVEDSAGNIWFGTRNSEIYRYDGNNFVRFSE